MAARRFMRSGMIMRPDTKVVHRRGGSTCGSVVS